MSADSNKSDGLKEQTAVAFAWSALHSWAVKLMSLFLFFMLARYLSPAQLGVAQSLMLMLMIIGMVAEQGLHGAVLAIRDLEADDINLPFCVSMVISILASIGMLIFSEEIARQLGDSEIKGLVQVGALVPPLVASTGFLVVMLRRAMDFKTIATASILASVMSTIASLGLAIGGQGALSILVQAAVSAAVTSAMIWRRTVWFPSWRLKTARARELFTFSATNFSVTLVDFLSQRLIEIVILGRYGFSALGLFTVGAKIYMAAVEMFTGTVFDVALRAMSRISDQVDRINSAYFRMVFLASGLVVPVFIWVAALAPEICITLFGAKWTGADQVLRWFAVLGAVQVMHFFNAAALSAMGQPGLNLRFSVVKLAAGAASLLLYKAVSLEEQVAAFVLSQLALAPYGYHMAAGVIKARRIKILRQLLPSILSSVIAYGVIGYTREYLVLTLESSILIGVILSLAYIPAFWLPFQLLTQGRFLRDLRGAARSLPILRRFGI
jgi:O-antigen/teichoic acid export membrane protein